MVPSVTKSERAEILQLMLYVYNAYMSLFTSLLDNAQFMLCDVMNNPLSHYVTN